MNSEAIDILMADETHFGHFSQLNLSVFSNWTSGKERGFGAKPGGRKLFLFSLGCCGSRWSHPWMATTG